MSLLGESLTGQMALGTALALTVSIPVAVHAEHLQEERRANVVGVAGLTATQRHDLDTGALGVVAKAIEKYEKLGESEDCRVTEKRWCWENHFPGEFWLFEEKHSRVDPHTEQTDESNLRITQAVGANGVIIAIRLKRTSVQEKIVHGWPQEGMASTNYSVVEVSVPGPTEEVEAEDADELQEILERGPVHVEYVGHTEQGIGYGSEIDETITTSPIGSEEEMPPVKGPHASFVEQRLQLINADLD